MVAFHPETAAMPPFDLSFRLSPYARRCAQKRGKRRDVLILVHRYGDLERRAGRRRSALRLSRQACCDLVAGGALPAAIDRARRVEIVVCDDNGVVVDVRDCAD
jgi:hypothetical protein